MNLKLDKLHRENLTSRVYEGIKEALIKGHFRPGEKIGIRKIASEMGTSPTPVREALLQLVSSHALEMKPAHSVTVPVLTKDIYLEIRELVFKIINMIGTVKIFQSPTTLIVASAIALIVVVFIRQTWPEKRKFWQLLIPPAIFAAAFALDYFVKTDLEKSIS